MAFSRFYVTEIGQNYLAKALTGKTLDITKAQIGSGYLPEGSSITAITALVSPIQDILLSDCSTAGDTTTVQAQFTNKTSGGDILAPFWWAEVGLFAKITDDADCPEALIAYANALDQAHADYIPGTLTEFLFDFVLNTDNASSVTAEINSSLIYLSTTSDLKTNVVTFTEANILEAPVSGENEATLWGKVKKLFSSLKGAAYTESSTYATAAQGQEADGAIQKNLATAADQTLVSNGAGSWIAKTLADIKTWLGLGSAASKTAGSAIGNVPVNGATLGITDNTPVVTDSSGNLKPHASGALGNAAFKAAGSASGNVPVNGAALGTTANVPVVTNTSGNLIPHASGALGTAAFKASGSASGNVPVNGAALGTTANVPVVTNTSGNLIPHASGALGTAAFKTTGSAAGNIPVVGSALGSSANVPVVTDANGNLMSHASGALGTAAFKTTGSVSGNIPVIGASLGTTANVPVVTNTSGNLIPHASGALGTAAFKATGPAAGNIPVNGAALGTTDNTPVVTDTSGNLKPHASGALGTAAFKATGDFQQPTNSLTAETAMDDSDYVPYYDTSATAHRKTLWSNIKLKLKTYFDTLYPSTSVATTSANGLMSSTDKTKLNGIAANANNYTHPTSGITAGTYKSVTVDDMGHATEGTNPTTLAGYGITDAAPSSHVGATGSAHGAVTTSANGFMISTDKTKLDGIASGAEVNVQSDWNESDTGSDAYIKNKPTNLPANGGTANTLTGLTATIIELNTLDGITATNTELNYVHGVTSAIQGQIDGKAPTSHNHTVSQIIDFPSSLPANGGNADTVDNIQASNLAKLYDQGCAVVDVNTLITPGIYYNINTGSTNAPESTLGTVYVSYVAHDRWLQQLWLGQYGAIWMRNSYDNSGSRAWNAWKRVYDSGMVQLTTSDPGAGVSSSLPNGSLIGVYTA